MEIIKVLYVSIYNTVFIIQYVCGIELPHLHYIL